VDGKAVTRDVPLGYFGKLQTEYEKRNQEYIRTLAGEAVDKHTLNTGCCGKEEEVAAHE
jgi:hypothetical protein